MPLDTRSDWHVCPRDWPGELCVIIASGPSTERIDRDLLQGRRIIAVCNGWRAAPRADVLLAGGMNFWRMGRHRGYRGPLMIGRQATRATYPISSPERIDTRLRIMRRAEATGISLDPCSLSGSKSSVTLAINYALHRGVSCIVLLGCDGQPGEDGRRRYGSDEPDEGDIVTRYREQDEVMATQIPMLHRLGVAIVNCSPGTVLTAYPTARLEDVL